ncbi:Protein CBG16276 [Caenorhabditis briggsae]|uniref:Protein CBG16276 n=1 Tax=Caenorhabditis briggsae TaxID=6238 RepID=A8XNR7_CAEBR|nr:Protein CBG16276 [Caenorhabditis briggsae]CAP34156.1 Protein CBG16276 [Caenorhabditis briggsae]
MVVTIIKHKPRNKRKALSALKDENGGKKSKLSEYSSKEAVDDIIESVDDMSNPLYDLLSNDFKSKEEFTVNDIAMMFKSLAETILKLQSQNTMLKNQNCILNANLSNLTEKVDGLEENLKLLSSQPKESPKPPTTLIKTFASAVASTISAPESQITFMRAASLANSEDARKSNGCLNAFPRPDLSKPELEKYRQSWKTVIQKNNEAGQTIYKVRNLEVVKVVYRENQEPWPWAKKHSIPENF